MGIYFPDPFEIDGFSGLVLAGVAIGVIITVFLLVGIPILSFLFGAVVL